MTDHFNKTGYVCILASDTVGTTYIGVTSDLINRITQHKNKIFKGFASDYGIDRLVYYEACGAMENAILREKELKKMNSDLTLLIDKLSGFRVRAFRRAPE